MSAQCLGHLPVQQALIIASNVFPYRFLQDVHETDDLPSYTITDAAGGTCRQGYFARYHVRTVELNHSIDMIDAAWPAMRARTMDIFGSADV